MGEALYDEIVGRGRMDQPCRIYAPVGSHEDLLAYLVRRLLENGANTSFVNRLADDEAPIADIISDPVEEVSKLQPIPHPRIPLPRDLFSPRINSAGLALWDEPTRNRLLSELTALSNDTWTAAPIIAGREVRTGEAKRATAPHDRRLLVGEVIEASDEAAIEAMAIASRAQRSWDC